MNEFDFEEWMELYKADPEEFEEKKAALLKSEIHAMTDDSEMQQRLEAILFNQDLRLSKFKDPVARFCEVQRQMNMQIGKFKAALNSPDYLKLQEKAKVLKLKNSGEQ